MAKTKKAALSQQPVGEDSPDQPRPTRPAFKPATSRDLWSGAGLALFCLVGFALGLGAWLDPSIAASLTEPINQNQTFGFWLIFIFPIFIPAAIYFAYQTWRDWRNTRTFERSKQTGTATITHLWTDRTQGKRRYVGYRYGEGHLAYQQVHPRTFGRLVLGEPVVVEYSLADPGLSRLDFQARPRERVTARKDNSTDD